MDGALKVSKSIQNLGIDSIPVKTDVTKIAEIENIKVDLTEKGKIW